MWVWTSALCFLLSLQYCDQAVDPRASGSRVDKQQPRTGTGHGPSRGKLTHGTSGLPKAWLLTHSRDTGVKLRPTLPAGKRGEIEQREDSRRDGLPPETARGERCVCRAAWAVARARQGEAFLRVSLPCPPSHFSLQPQETQICLSRISKGLEDGSGRSQPTRKSLVTHRKGGRSQGFGSGVEAGDVLPPPQGTL